MPPPQGTLRTLLRLFPRLAHFAYVQEVKKQLRSCKSCLEIGCGADSPARMVGFERYVGLDGHGPVIEEAKRNDLGGEYVLGRAEDIVSLFGEKSFDCVVGLDLIEHLTKEDGLRLIADMERVARKRVLLFTPNGFLPQESRDGDLQEHLSGWTAEEMRDLEFRVVGMHGPKGLRGDHHKPKIKPAALGSAISQLLQLYTRHAPGKAAAILCVKDVPAP